MTHIFQNELFSTCNSCFRCQGKIECSFEVNNSWYGTDPCVGTYKYLEVQYECVPDNAPAAVRAPFFKFL